MSHEGDSIWHVGACIEAIAIALNEGFGADLVLALNSVSENLNNTTELAEAVRYSGERIENGLSLIASQLSRVADAVHRQVDTTTLERAK